MKRLLLALLAFSFATISAVAQIGGPGPGPGPVPSPWVVNGSTIYYNGCITVPVTVTSGCKGNGTANFGGLYVNGVAVSAGGSINPGTAGQLGYYAATGSAISGLTPGNLIQLSTGKSVVNPNTSVLENVTPVQTVTGASHVYVAGDLYERTIRSNSGSAMTDTLPVPATLGIVNGTKITVSNADASAAITLSAGAGSTINGASSISIPAGKILNLQYNPTGTNWVFGDNSINTLAVANNLSDVASATTALANLGGAPLASPTFTGTPAAPTATAGTSTTQIATTAFVNTSFAKIASPTFTGTPAAPTATAGTNTTQIATTAFVATSFAPLNSPALTGTPTVPTATAGTNTTQAASTAFVTTAVANSLVTAPVRQTVLSGPLASGLPSFLPSTSGSLSLTSQNISTGVNALVVTAAQGFGATGAANAVGVATSNQTWSSLTASSTIYLGETVSGGTLTTLFTTTQPIYQCFGTISVTNGQYTFDTCGYQMYLGNGTVANPVNVVFVGEAVTSGSAVTSTVAYAYQGRFDSGFIATFPATGTLTTFNSNIGVTDVTISINALVTTANNGYSVGDIITFPFTTIGSGTVSPFPTVATRNASTFTTGAITSISLANKTTGVAVAGTNANFSYRLFVKRNF